MGKNIFRHLWSEYTLDAGQNIIAAIKCYQGCDTGPGGLNPCNRRHFRQYLRDQVGIAEYDRLVRVVGECLFRGAAGFDCYRNSCKTGDLLCKFLCIRGND